MDIQPVFNEYKAVTHTCHTNPPKQRLQVLLSKKEFIELRDNSQKIFRKSNIACNMERPCATFCNGKDSILENFYYAEFLAYYTIENKSSKTCEYYTDELNENVVKNNHEECPYHTSPPPPKKKIKNK